MVSEALENIVENTYIDIYPPGTTALYWGFHREEEEMMHMEDQRKEIDSAIRAQYTDAPQNSQWALDQPSYEVEITYSGDSNIEIIEEPVQWHGNGGSFTTHVEPEPLMMAGGFGLVPEPIEEHTISSIKTTFLVGEDDYSHMMDSVPEQDFTPQITDNGCAWNLTVEPDPSYIKPFDPMQEMGIMGIPNTHSDPFQSYLEDTHYSPRENPYQLIPEVNPVIPLPMETMKSNFSTDFKTEPYLPAIKPLLDINPVPKLEPIDYTFPVNNTLNQDWMPELDFKPKPDLPSSLNYLPDMNLVIEPEPYTPPLPVSSLIEDTMSSARDLMDSLKSQVEPPALTQGLTKDTYPYNLMGDKYNPMDTLSTVRDKFGHFLADKEENNPGDFSLLHPNEDNGIYKTIEKIKGGNKESWWMTQLNNGEVAVHGYDRHSGESSHPSNLHLDLGVNHDLGYKLGVEKKGSKTIKDLWPLFEK